MGLTVISISVSGGAHNGRHNTDAQYRTITLVNVDPDLTSENVIVRDQPLPEAYAELFGAAVAAHDERQMAAAKPHPERCYGDAGGYLEKVSRAHRNAQDRARGGRPKSANVPPPCIEYVVQLGNHETWGKLGVDEHVAILQEAARAIEERTAADGGGIRWFQVTIHLDEKDGSPHMHMAGVPYATGCRRGLETQVSLGGALRALGLQRKPDLQNLMMQEVESVAEGHGVVRDVRGEHRRHQDVAEWKQTMRDTEAATERLERLRGREDAARESVSELQSATEPVAESARYLTEHRGDGGRERDARERNRELAAEKAALEHECEELAGDARGLGRAVSSARERLHGLRARSDGLRERVGMALEALREPFSRLIGRWGIRALDDAPWGAQMAANRLGLDSPGSAMSPVRDMETARAVFRTTNRQASGPGRAQGIDSR